MGALTEMADSYLEEQGYYRANDIWESLEYLFPAPDVYVEIEDRKKIIQYIVSDYDDSLMAYVVKRNLYHFWNIENKTYFFFYPWEFGEELKDSIEQIKKVCDKTEGLSYRERMSTDNDFFLFRPKEHGLGLEITDLKNRSPPEMTELFQHIKHKDAETVSGVGYIWFRW